MKRVCTVCQRVSVDGNLWCQEPDCPAGNMPLIFDYGEWLGDIKVVRLLRVLRTSAIYEAERDKEQVLLKVAHPGCQDQLRREARVLLELAAHQQHPMLPVLLPAYQQMDLKQRPYGKTMFRDEAKYYEVFAHAQGEFLRDLLLKNPQPWYQHAAWMTISLADAIAFLHLRGKVLHLNLTPDVIYVRTDKEGIPRPLLLDLGMLGDPTGIDPAWVRRYGVPAYTPPELIARDGPVGYASDVYGLGLVLYEMLAGKPPFESPSPRELLNMQCTQAPPPLGDKVRGALPKGIERLLFELLEKRPDDRPGSAADVLHELEPFAPASGGARRRTRPSATVPAASEREAEATAKKGPEADVAERPAPRPKQDKPRADTIALVEKAAAPRDVPARTGLLIVVLLSLIAGLVTYLVRASGSDDEPRNEPALTANPRSEAR